MNKQHFQTQFKTVSTKEASAAAKDIGGVVIQGYASTPTLDRHRDVVEPEAFRETIIKNYRKNPIILFQHDHDRPIGKATSMSIDDKGLFIEAVIVDDQIGPKVKAGILKTLSIGYTVLDAKYTDEDGNELSPDVQSQRERILFDPTVKRVITKLELYENSVVSVPANPDALFDVRKSLKTFFDDKMYENILSEKDGVILYKGEKGLVQFPLSEGWTKRSVKRWLEINHTKLSSLTDVTMKKENLLEVKSEDENVDAPAEQVKEAETNPQENEEQNSPEATEENATEKEEDAGEESAEPAEAPAEGEEPAVEEDSQPAEAEEAAETPADETGGEGEAGETDGEGAEPVEGDAETDAEKSWTPERQDLALKTIKHLSDENAELKAHIAKLESQPAKKSLVYSEHSVAPQAKETSAAEKKDTSIAGEAKTGLIDALVSAAS